MRKELMLILLLLAGAAFLVYTWAGSSPLALFGARGLVNVGNNTRPLPVVDTTETSAQHAKPVPGRGRGLASGTKPQPLAESPLPLTTTALPAKRTLAVNCCADTTRAFPTPESIGRGSTKTEIRATYGAPTMSIAGTREGRVLESYYYVSSDKTRLTIAHIENGVIVSAEALSSPYFSLPGPQESSNTTDKTAK
jgi:hypothetical protein